MGIFFWKKNKQIDTFAFQIADDLYSEIQPEAATKYLELNQKHKQAKDKESKGLSKEEEKTTRKLKDTILRIQQYRALHKLGIYGKARLHLTFTGRLEELGYDKATAKELNHIILLATP